MKLEIRIVGNARKSVRQGLRISFADIILKLVSSQHDGMHTLLQISLCSRLGLLDADVHQDVIRLNAPSLSAFASVFFKHGFWILVLP